MSVYAFTQVLMASHHSTDLPQSMNPRAQRLLMNVNYGHRGTPQISTLTVQYARSVA